MPFESAGAKYKYTQYNRIHIKAFIQCTIAYHVQTLSNPLSICQQKVPVTIRYRIVQVCSSRDGLEFPGLHTLQFYRTGTVCWNLTKQKLGKGTVSTKNNILFYDQVGNTWGINNNELFRATHYDVTSVWIFNGIFRFTYLALNKMVDILHTTF